MEKNTLSDVGLKTLVIRMLNELNENFTSINKRAWKSLKKTVINEGYTN